MGSEGRRWPTGCSDTAGDGDILPVLGSWAAEGGEVEPWVTTVTGTVTEVFWPTVPVLWYPVWATGPPVWVGNTESWLVLGTMLLWSCCILVAGTGSHTSCNKNKGTVKTQNRISHALKVLLPSARENYPPGWSSPKDASALGGTRTDSRGRGSGTGLTMKRRPAECTTCAARLGGPPVKYEKSTLRNNFVTCNITKLAKKSILVQSRLPGKWAAALSGNCWFESLVTYNDHQY